MPLLSVDYVLLKCLHAKNTMRRYQLVLLTVANLARTCIANCWCWFSPLLYWTAVNMSVMLFSALTPEVNGSQHYMRWLCADGVQVCVISRRVNLSAWGVGKWSRHQPCLECVPEKLPVQMWQVLCCLVPPKFVIKSWWCSLYCSILWYGSSLKSLFGFLKLFSLKQQYSTDLEQNY